MNINEPYLQHWKYIRKTKTKSGKWRYIYPDDMKNLSKQKLDDIGYANSIEKSKSIVNNPSKSISKQQRASEVANIGRKTFLRVLNKIGSGKLDDRLGSLSKKGKKAIDKALARHKVKNAKRKMNKKVLNILKG